MVSFKLKASKRTEVQEAEDWASKLLDGEEDSWLEFRYGYPHNIHPGDIVQIKASLDMYYVDSVMDRVHIRLMSERWDNLGRGFDFLPDRINYRILSSLDERP